MSTAQDTKRIIDAIDKWGQALQKELDRLRDAILLRIDGHSSITRSRLVDIGLVVSGEKYTVFPWHKLIRDKRIQVEAVFNYMRERKDLPDDVHNINKAVESEFKDLPDGYHSKADLKAYCYRPNVRDYLESRA